MRLQTFLKSVTCQRTPRTRERRWPSVPVSVACLVLAGCSGTGDPVGESPVTGADAGPRAPTGDAGSAVPALDAGTCPAATGMGDDTMPPTVVLTSPLDGASLAGIVTLTAAACDDVGVAEVEFQWDSQAFGAADTTAPYTFEWDTTAFTDGFYTLTAVARDAAGHETVSGLATVQVDNSVAPPPPPPPPPGGGRTLRVPEDYATIQDAIDAAASGDTVLIAPGEYSGGLLITGKAVRLASRYSLTGAAEDIEATVLRGGSPTIQIDESAGGSSVVGLTLTRGSKGVVAFAPTEVLNNRFIDVGADAMSHERTGGVIRGNYFESSSDDAIDLDGPDDVIIEDNVLIGSGDDGIEIRNFNYSGALRVISICGNHIQTSDEDGIQLIDYADNSDRRFIIERNVILDSTDVGVGIMDNGETREDFRAAAIPEHVYLFNNTLVGNQYGVTGGANLVAVNNIIASSATLGMKGVGGASDVSYNLFWNNGTDHQGSNVDLATTVLADPRLDANYRVGAGSPSIDAGIARFVWNGTVVLDIPTAAYRGGGPDIGRFEAGAPTAPGCGR